MLRLDGLTFAHGEQRFTFDLAVERGEILSVIGPSGAGKSTLLMLVAGFLAARHGRVWVDGQDITALAPESRPVTTVFQEHNLFPHLSVFDNVALGTSPGLRLDAAGRRQVDEALARVRLDDLAGRRPDALSGGQRQRVALARVLVRERPVLLLDEPLTALGPALRAELLDLIAELVCERRMAAILVSHHPGDARRVSPRTAFLHQGRVHALAATAGILDADDPVIVDYLGQ